MGGESDQLPRRASGEQPCPAPSTPGPAPPKPARPRAEGGSAPPLLRPPGSTERRSPRCRGKAAWTRARGSVRPRAAGSVRWRAEGHSRNAPRSPRRSISASNPPSPSPSSPSTRSVVKRARWSRSSLRPSSHAGPAPSGPGAHSDSVCPSRMPSRRLQWRGRGRTDAPPRRGVAPAASAPRGCDPWRPRHPRCGPTAGTSKWPRNGPRRGQPAPARR